MSEHSGLVRDWSHRHGSWLDREYIARGHVGRRWWPAFAEFSQADHVRFEESALFDVIHWVSHHRAQCESGVW